MLAEMDRISADEIDITEGVCTKPRVQVLPGFSASKDMLSFGTSVPSSPQLSARSTGAEPPPLPYIESGIFHPCCTKRVSVVKQAPTKRADLQVQAVDLSRESKELQSSHPLPPWRLEDGMADGHADASLESRLAKCVENFLGQHSSDVLDLHAPAATMMARKGLCSSSNPVVVEGHRGVHEALVETQPWRKSPSRGSETGRGLTELLDARMTELGQKLMSSVSEMLESRVETRLAALESQAAQRTSSENDVARTMSDEISAMGRQIDALCGRVSKIASSPNVSTAHVTSLEDRVITLDRSLSELRCEYLEGCLRAHQMEELVLALHSNVRDLRAYHSESKHASMANCVDDAGATCSHSSSSTRDATDLHSAQMLAQQTPGARLETISEAPVDESSEDALAEEVHEFEVHEQFFPQTSQASEECDSSVAEPEPETEEPGIARLNLLKLSEAEPESTEIHRVTKVRV